MTIADKNQQYSLDFSADCECNQKVENRANAHVVSLTQALHRQERVKAVNRLRESQIFDTSRFEELIEQS